MKTLNKILLVFLLVAGVAACKKDKNGGDGGTAAEGTMKAKIGSANWTSIKMSTSASYVKVGATGTLTMLGADASGKTINIIVNGYDGSTGTWEIPSGVGGINVTASYVEMNISNPTAPTAKTYVAPYSGGTALGEVKISEFSETGNVKGTFEFKTRNQDDNNDFKDITGGAFNIKVSTH